MEQLSLIPEWKPLPKASGKEDGRPVLQAPSNKGGICYRPSKRSPGRNPPSLTHSTHCIRTHASCRRGCRIECLADADSHIEVQRHHWLRSKCIERSPKSPDSFSCPSSDPFCAGPPNEKPAKATPTTTVCRRGAFLAPIPLRQNPPQGSAPQPKPTSLPAPCAPTNHLRERSLATITPFDTAFRHQLYALTAKTFDSLPGILVQLLPKVQSVQAATGYRQGPARGQSHREEKAGNKRATPKTERRRR
ncbi:hypothetical protein B0T14DRAFT_338828 [Immersiella caudata]|uniref:Uncharacterized protein n=1 Tax=Immersiella caudata TaxID=314043 RepID=A0AA39TNX9_9PEZI|nr:hypothetical protein B0T14DRAFT_338828 [Immersiella caudata]